MATIDSVSATELSVVIPVMNEEESLVELHQTLTKVLVDLGQRYEIIFIDDGSTDRSVRLCKDIAKADPRVTAIQLRRNFGKATALSVGFQTACGRIVITMDSDLQDDPNEIPNFLREIEAGADLVSGWKRDRKDPITKTFPSRCINMVTRRLSGVALNDFNCGFKAYRQEVAKSLNIYGELYRYIPVIADSNGYRVVELPVKHHPRRFGKSKYGIGRFLKGTFDLITVLFLTGFQRRPLHLFGTVGALFFGLGFTINLYLSILWMMGQGPIGNRPLLLMGTLLILIGIQVIGIGLIAELVTSVSHRRDDTTRLISSKVEAGAEYEMIRSFDPIDNSNGLS